MSQERTEAYKYPKLFFVCPNQAYLPREEMEKAFFKEDGFELSYIEEDGTQTKEAFLQMVVEKILIITDLYPSSIFFFNLHAKHYSEDDWIGVMSRLSKAATREEGGKILLGVFHEIPILRQKTIGELVASPSCIVKMNTRPHANRINILNAITPLKLSKRAVIRLNCMDSWVIFERQGKKMKGRILDISKNHVSCDLPVPANFAPNEILKATNLELEGGRVLQVDAIFMSSRPMSNGNNLCLFFFSDNPSDYLRRGARPNTYSANVGIIEDWVMRRLRTYTQTKIRKNETLKTEALTEIQRLQDHPGLPGGHRNPHGHHGHAVSTHGSDQTLQTPKTKVIKGSAVSRFLGDVDIEISED